MNELLKRPAWNHPISKLTLHGSISPLIIVHTLFLTKTDQCALSFQTKVAVFQSKKVSGQSTTKGGRCATWKLYMEASIVRGFFRTGENKISEQPLIIVTT
jgi:hypothetical protein